LTVVSFFPLHCYVFLYYSQADASHTNNHVVKDGVNIQDSTSDTQKASLHAKRQWDSPLSNT
jgi:hypothetical protein